MKLHQLVSFTIVGAAALATTMLVAQLSDDEHDDPRAAQWLARHPDRGTLTGPEEISYTTPNGQLLIITFDPVPGNADAPADCPDLQLCLYAGTGYSYPRATTHLCGYLDLTGTGWARQTRSVRNNLPSGANGAGTVEFLSDARTDHHDSPDDNQHRVLTLTPASRTAVTIPPDIDYLYHQC